MKTEPCFECGKPMRRAIVSGFPSWVCLEEEHEAVPCDHGIWSWITAWVPFDGLIVTYDKGEFLSAWWGWFKHAFHSSDE